MRRRIQIVPYKRKRQSKTNFRKRLNILKSGKPRFVVRKTLKNIVVQIINYHPDGDKVLISANTNELKKKYGWNIARRNTPAAYLTGLLAGKKALKSKIKGAVLDIGMVPATSGSVVFAALKGAVDSGLDIPHSKEIFPSEDRMQGKHIKNMQQVQFSKIKEKIAKEE